MKQDSHGFVPVSRSQELQKVLEKARRFATAPDNVIITGETGVGKGVIAEYIHNQSFRKGAFIGLNCSEFGPLLRSELFGHAKGAFTDAYHDQVGKFEEAGEGTIFLDEIGDMDPKVQPMFLKVLENKTFTRVGENVNRELRARIIAGTNVNLREAIEVKRFRQDLMNRFPLPIHISPLRERKSDIPALFLHFWKEHAIRYGFESHDKDFSTFAEELVAYPFDWRDNARSVEKLVQRAMAEASPDAEKFIPCFREELLMETRMEFSEKHSSLEVALVNYIGRELALLLNSKPKPKVNLNEKIQTLLTSGMALALEKLMTSGGTLSHLKCAGIGDLLGQRELSRSGISTASRPLNKPNTNYAYLNNALLILFERFEEEGILIPFLGMDLYDVIRREARSSQSPPT